ncbi:hypothetical protein [Flavobacterium album]|nr:hypothetical protein [Flavobacterium album]
MHSSLMNFDGMRNFIIENELTDSVVIALHPESFDTLALDYIRIHETIERPFEILGIEIVEDTTNTVPKNHFRIIEL